MVASAARVSSQCGTGAGDSGRITACYTSQVGASRPWLLVVAARRTLNMRESTSYDKSIDAILANTSCCGPPYLASLFATETKEHPEGSRLFGDTL